MPSPPRRLCVASCAAKLRVLGSVSSASASRHYEPCRTKTLGSTSSSWPWHLDFVPSEAAVTSVPKLRPSRRALGGRPPRRTPPCLGASLPCRCSWLLPFDLCCCSQPACHRQPCLSALAWPLARAALPSRHAPELAPGCCMLVLASTSILPFPLLQNVQIFMHVEDVCMDGQLACLRMHWYNM